MKTLDRYIMGEILGPFLLSLLGLTFFMVTFQIVKSIEFLLRYQVSIWIIVESYLYFTPIVLALTLPMSLLIGILLAFGRLSGDSEIIAMKAGGVSVARMFLPALLFAVVPYLICQGIFWSLLPMAEHSLRMFKFRLARSEVTPDVKPQQFIEFVDNTVLFARSASDDNRQFNSVFLYQRETMERPASVIIAKNMRKIIDEERTVFRLEEATIHRLDRAALDRYMTDTADVLDFDVMSILEKELNLPKEFSMMSFGELMEVVEENPTLEEPKPLGPLWVELFRRISTPIACLIFPLLGVALGITNRRGGKSSGFAVAVGLFIVYYMLMMFGERLGAQGALPPLLATFLPAIFLSGLGAALMYVVSQERQIDLTGWAVRIGKRLAALGARLFEGLTKRQPGARGPSGFGFPRIIDRYMGKTFLRFYFMVLAICFAVSFLVHFTEKIAKFLQHDATIPEMLGYFLFKNLFFVFIAMHFAMLVAVILTLGALSKNSEITAMKVGGVSIYRIYAPFIALGLLLSVGIYFYNEHVVPAADSRAEEIERYDIRGRERPVNGLGLQRWLRGRDNALYRYSHYEASEDALLRVSYFEFDENARLRRRLEAHRASWQGDGWRLENVREYRFREDGFVEGISRIPAMPIDLGLKPEDYEQQRKKRRSMTRGELTERIRLLESLGYDATDYRVATQSKVAQSFIGLVMLLLGLPYGIVPPRQGGLGRGVGVAFGVALGFYITFNVFINLGYIGVLSPFWAAWGANLLFGGWGVLMLLVQKR